MDTHTAGLPWKAMVSKEHRIQWSHLFTFFETKVGVKKRKETKSIKKGVNPRVLENKEKGKG